MSNMSPEELRLKEAIEDLLDLRPARVIPLFTEVLRDRDVRVLLAAVGLGDFPQVAATLDMDDVTEEVTKQVIVRVLDRVGMSKDAATLMAGTAGTVVARWIAQQRRMRQARATQGGGQPQGGRR